MASKIALLQYFDTVGRVTGRAPGMQKHLAPAISKVLLWKAFGERGLTWSDMRKNRSDESKSSSMSSSSMIITV